VADLEKEIVRLKKEGAGAGEKGAASAAREVKEVQEQLESTNNKLRSKEVERREKRWEIEKREKREERREKRRKEKRSMVFFWCFFFTSATSKDELKRVRGELNDATDKEIALRDEMRKLRSSAQQQNGGSGAELEEAKAAAETLKVTTCKHVRSFETHL
jgi:DNA repair exonuclease SbcCD ATPase subunit